MRSFFKVQSKLNKWGGKGSIKNTQNKTDAGIEMHLTRPKHK